MRIGNEIGKRHWYKGEGKDMEKQFGYPVLIRRSVNMFMLLYVHLKNDLDPY